MRLIAITLLLLAGCDAAPDAASARNASLSALPTAATLKTGLGSGCDCVLRDHCPVADEISGWPEVRNVNCAWASEGIARCRWDERFVADNGGDRIEPGPWHRNDGDFQALEGGGFCVR